MIALLRKVADTGNSEGAEWAKMRIHMVPNSLMATLGYSSKLSNRMGLPEHAQGGGRTSAEAFLEKDGDKLGVQSSIDLDVLLEGV